MSLYRSEFDNFPSEYRGISNGSAFDSRKLGRDSTSAASEFGIVARNKREGVRFCVGASVPDLVFIIGPC